VRTPTSLHDLNLRRRNSRFRTLVVNESGHDALRRSYGSIRIGAPGRHIPVTPRIARIGHESVRVGDDSQITGRPILHSPAPRQLEIVRHLLEDCAEGLLLRCCVQHDLDARRRGGTGRSNTSVAHNSTAPQGAFGSIQKMDLSMEGKIFLLPQKPENERAVTLKDFDSLPSTGSVFADKWDIPSRSFTEGFPGVTNRFEWFSITYQGSIYIPATGRYAFRLSSDDGSKLFLDDVLVIDDDGVHPMTDKSATVTLNQGNHGFRLRYFQNPPVQIGLQLFVKEPGGQEKIFALQDFNQKLLESRRRLHLTEDAHAIHIRLGSEVLFDSGKSALRPEAATSLQQLAEVLLGEPGLQVSIEGHTDNEGSEQHNQTLSEQRAEAVKQWLATSGRVPGGCIATRGFGASKPVVSNASAAARQKNRRVEISIQKSQLASGA
jgi:outer membrane protein OmpA-like peptidoglycan-associated protein